MASDSDDRPSSRKRARTSVNGGEDSAAGNKKARGRPRVDTEDQTAADRRRTQIRLAQRAYRQRKESTISSLKEQNAGLQSIIEQMNKAFLRFNESALKSGLLQLSPSLAKELKQVTETFVSLAKAATEGQQEAEEETADSVGDQATEISSDVAPIGNAAQDRLLQQETQPQPQNVDIGWGYTATIDDNARIVNHQTKEGNGSIFTPPLNSPFGNNNQALTRLRRPVSVGHVMDQSTSWKKAPQDNNRNQDSQPLPFGLIELLNRQEYSPTPPSPIVYAVQIPTPDISPPMARLPTPPYLRLPTKSLRSTWTYSHDETTFARRLTRAALETGFHLLSAAGQRPAALNYVFKLSLPYLSLNELRERFKTLLARGTDEDLDCWDTPFIHLGGAGTHYPRKDAEGNIVPIPNAWTVRRIGPISSKLIRAENVVDPSQNHDLNIDLTGFEGEWFDAHDVQGYLEREKGCHIDPRSSFAEVLLDEDEEVNRSDVQDLFLGNRPMRFDYPHPRRQSISRSETPSFGNSSSTTASSSNSSPGENIGATSDPIDNIFVSSDAPFGLAMDSNLPMTPNPVSTDFTKFPNVDPSTYFDQPLRLDITTDFPTNLDPSNVNLGNTLPALGMLGLDLGHGEPRSLPILRQRRKKAAWVDVSKLVDEIIRHGVCLGRSPGFRRKDVDMAFQASLIMAN